VPLWVFLCKIKLEVWLGVHILRSNQKIKVMTKEEKKLVKILKDYKKALLTLDQSEIKENFIIKFAIMQINDEIFDIED
jgi:hypothetical protein